MHQGPHVGTDGGAVLLLFPYRTPIRSPSLVFTFDVIDYYPQIGGPDVLC